MKLIEYRPGRYAWADPATGKVLRKATAEEADTELARLFAGQSAGNLEAMDGAPDPLDRARRAAEGQELGDCGVACAPSRQPSAVAGAPLEAEQEPTLVANLTPTVNLTPAAKLIPMDNPTPAASSTPTTNPAPVASDHAAATDNVAAFWLWVDPRREPGFDPKTFDPAAFLARAVALFQTKERWGGQPPTVVVANPAQAENGLGPMAKALGLAVVSDPIVAPGTYRLGLASERRDGDGALGPYDPARVRVFSDTPRLGSERRVTE